MTLDENPPMEPELAELLASPGVWHEPPAGLADEIAAAISAEAAPSAPPSVGASVETPRTRRPPWLIGVVSGVAAALVVIVGFAALTADSDSDDDADGVELALAGTELAPAASATAVVAETPLGTRILLDVSDLPPAPPESYYEAWLRVDAEVGVSAGTFHMRGGDGSIELWAGVSPDDYPLMTVTMQESDDGAESSGRVVLRGLIDTD